MKKTDIHTKIKDVAKSWTELTPDQRLFTLKLLFNYVNGHMSYAEVRSAYVIYMLNIKIPFSALPKQIQKFHENLFVLAYDINFFFKLSYSPKTLFNRLPEKLKKILRHTPPEDVQNYNNPQFLSIARTKLKYEHDIVFPLIDNPLPELKIGEEKLQGYKFSFVDKTIDTDLTADTFITLVMIYNKIQTSDTSEFLYKFISLLYADQQLSEEENLKLIRKIKPFEAWVILNYYAAWMSYIMKKSAFSFLFQDKKRSSGSEKFSLGIKESLFELSKKGYGSTDELKKESFLEFLEKLVVELKSTINEMAAMKIDSVTIASKLKMSVDSVEYLKTYEDDNRITEVFREVSE